MHPVKGKLTRAGQAVSSGTLSFTPEGELPPMMIQAAVGADGSFEVVTMDSKSGKKHQGAPAATYKVIYLPGGADQTVPPTELAQPVVVEARANELKLDLAGR
jgi:hypothetical protein